MFLSIVEFGAVAPLATMIKDVNKVKRKIVQINGMHIKLNLIFNTSK